MLFGIDHMGFVRAFVGDLGALCGSMLFPAG